MPHGQLSVSLLGNRNRFATMLNLTAKYLFWHRSHNAIVGETPTIVLDHPVDVAETGCIRLPGSQPEDQP